VYNVDLSSAQPFIRHEVCTNAVKYDYGICKPDNHITGGSSIFVQLLYCFIRFEKWVIQLPNFFYVWGASFAHLDGKLPFYKERAKSSNSELIPISPLKALFKLIKVSLILSISLLNLSNSWNNTILVGPISSL
jgi:hypothetical protein